VRLAGTCRVDATSASGAVHTYLPLLPTRNQCRGIGGTMWFFFATGAAVFTALWLAIRLEIWLGLAPRQTQNASSARHTGRHHRCQRMPAARHPGLCRSLKAPADSGSPGRLGRGPHPGRISLRARPGHGDPLVAPPGRPLAQKACSSTPPAGSCRQSSSSPPRLPSSPRAHGWPCSRSGYLS
jgi:hypothetical protein